MPKGTTRLLSLLRTIVGDGHVLTDPGATAGYTTDWTGRFGGPATAVVRPGSTEEVAAVLRGCAAHGVAVVPQGGNTGLVGGGVPRAGEVVLSLRRLDHIGDVDPSTPSIPVEAGTTLSAVQGMVAPHGLAVGVDLAARDSATVGGMVATNAGGLHVVAHGSMRHQVLGLEAVLADGTVLRRMPGLVKDNAGYDLPQLLAGSEGTLAVITAVSLRLVERATTTTVLLVGCRSVSDALVVARGARQLPGLHAVEMMSAAGVRLVAEHRNRSAPVTLAEDEVMLLLEWSHGLDQVDLADLLGGRDGVVAQDAADVAELWSWREQHTEAISRKGVGVKLDVTVPLDAIAQAVQALAVVQPLAITFGHLAEGSLHINLLPPTEASAAADGWRLAAEKSVLQVVTDHGGSIAAEHGIGVAKVPYLALTRSPEEITVMRHIKAALDPGWLLNPGVLLPSRST